MVYDFLVDELFESQIEHIRGEMQRVQLGDMMTLAIIEKRLYSLAGIALRVG